MIAYLIWDPPREMFSWNLPLLGRPILWYGFLFALAFFLGYLLLISFLKKEIKSKVQIHQIAEKFLLYMGLGTVIGARIGDVVFYQDPSIWLSHPLSIFYVWEGGLASHGAAIGCVIAMMLLSRHLQKSVHLRFSFWKIFDFVAIPTCLGGAFIRLGNFINQEILGVPSTVPWAILFLHPAGRLRAQLYEKVEIFNEAVHTYNELILKAAQEVADKISAALFLQNQIQKESTIFSDVQKRLFISYIRMKHALDFSLPFLAIENELLQEELNLKLLEYSKRLIQIELIYALGGGYNP